jgi:hypothetical protein
MGRRLPEPREETESIIEEPHGEGSGAGCTTPKAG